MAGKDNKEEKKYNYLNFLEGYIFTLQDKIIELNASLLDHENRCNSLLRFIDEKTDYSIEDILRYYDENAEIEEPVDKNKLN